MSEDVSESAEVIDAEVVEGVEVPRNEEVVESVEHGMKKMYLSGPMTGIEKYNHDLFHRVAHEFRSVGFMVCSPGEFFDGDRTKERKEYMRESVKYLLEADTIVLLPGWEKSKGARLEAAIATELELSIMEYVERDEVENGDAVDPTRYQDGTPVGSLTSTERERYPATFTPLTPEEAGEPEGDYGTFTKN